MLRLCPVSIIVMLVIQEEIFKSAVESEGDRCDTQAGEGALETVISGERPRVSPFFPA